MVGGLFWAGLASAEPVFMNDTAKQLQEEAAIHAADQALTPPAPPCPESGFLPSPFSNCGVPETPATSLPYMGNMAYWGGHVQVHPAEYLVLWGWGEPGAFPANQACQSETFTEGSLSATLKCDPDGAGKYMADFLQQAGGTGWANVSTQYYQTDSSGNKQYISNDPNILAGIWVDENLLTAALRSARRYQWQRRHTLCGPVVVEQRGQRRHRILRRSRHRLTGALRAIRQQHERGVTGRVRLQQRLILRQQQWLG